MGKSRDDRGLGPDRLLGWFALEQRRSRRVRLRILDAGERHLALNVTSEPLLRVSVTRMTHVP